MVCGSYLTVAALFSEYSGNKNEGSDTPFATMSEYDILVFYYFLAVKVMLLADCSSQHKKILSNNILIQLTVQQK
ncbi:hypothetical protein EEM01_16600 [Salmonella enterica]|uniref:Uncharacterized protein n=1 Tax=Salmonella enterica TaxID=28901 RepID=A0A3J4PLZ9_SALER|nr:hypothetical protein [Salmonella enterica]